MELKTVAEGAMILQEGAEEAEERHELRFDVLVDECVLVKAKSEAQVLPTYKAPLLGT
jgi:hypothetical protein